MVILDKTWPETVVAVYSYGHSCSRLWPSTVAAGYSAGHTSYCLWPWTVLTVMVWHIDGLSVSKPSISFPVFAFAYEESWSRLRNDPVVQISRENTLILISVYFIVLLHVNLKMCTYIPVQSVSRQKHYTGATNIWQNLWHRSSQTTHYKVSRLIYRSVKPVDRSKWSVLTPLPPHQ